MPKKRTRAISYLRVSGPNQVKGHGFARQRATIRRYARSHKIDLIDECRDEVSGTKAIEARPGLAELLDRLESNGIQLVLVERADRIARDLVIGELILSRLRDLGVTVIECDGGNDLTAGNQDDPTGVLIRQVLGAVSQFDKSVIVLKLKAARDRTRKEKGRCEGKKPFGTRPGEAATLRRIRQLRRKPRGRKRRSYADVARILNEENRPTRHGRPWRPSSIYDILKRCKQQKQTRPS